MSNFINLTLVDDGHVIKVDAMVIDAMRPLELSNGEFGSTLHLRSCLEIDIRETTDEVEALINEKVEEFMQDEG